MSSVGMRVDVEGVHGCNEVFLGVLNAIIGKYASTRSMIDLCCNLAPLTRELGFGKRVYVDILERDLGEENPHFIQADVLGDHEVFQQQYDVSLCLDGIEHLHKDQGIQLLERMKSISDKRIIFTPLDPWMMEPHNPHPETHKSIWTPDDLPGWASIVYPVYHPTLNIGAWFGWHCGNIESDFRRVCRELKFA